MVQMMKNIIRGNKQVPGANAELLLAMPETYFMQKKRSDGSSLPIFCLEEEDEKKNC
jgi:hypothetical protein